MAVIRDVMPVFELYQPGSVDDAIKLLDKHGADALVLAGGLDSMDWLKDRLKKPKAVVDLGTIKELKGVKELKGGIEIGAMTPLTEVVKHPMVRDQFSLLMEAAELVASPQIRNQGTIGGNVSQDTRCWYYRGGWTCYRAGGNICYADTPTAVNREHAIFDADRCVAVNPSDTAPALVALDAAMVIRGPKGERIVPAEQYWIGPGIDITRMNVLAPNEILTAIRIPSTMAGAQFYFETLRDRPRWDFALVNVASAIVVTGDPPQAQRPLLTPAPAPPRVGCPMGASDSPAFRRSSSRTRPLGCAACARPGFRSRGSSLPGTRKASAARKPMRSKRCDRSPSSTTTFPTFAACLPRCTQPWCCGRRTAVRTRERTWRL